MRELCHQLTFDVSFEEGEGFESLMALAELELTVCQQTLPECWRSKHRTTLFHAILMSSVTHNPEIYSGKQQLANSNKKKQPELFQN